MEKLNTLIAKLLPNLTQLGKELDQLKVDYAEGRAELQQQVNDINNILTPLQKVRDIQIKIHEWLDEQDKGLEHMPFATFYFATKNRLNNLFIGLAAVTSGQVERKKSWKDISGECFFASLGLVASAVVAGVTLGPGAAFAPAIISGSLMLGKETFDKHRDTSKLVQRESARFL